MARSFSYFLIDDGFATPDQLRLLVNGGAAALSAWSMRTNTQMTLEQILGLMNIGFVPRIPIAAERLYQQHLLQAAGVDRDFQLEEAEAYIGVGMAMGGTITGLLWLTKVVDGLVYAGHGLGAETALSFQMAQENGKAGLALWAMVFGMYMGRAQAYNAWDKTQVLKDVEATLQGDTPRGWSKDGSMVQRQVGDGLLQVGSGSSPRFVTVNYQGAVFGTSDSGDNDCEIREGDMTVFVRRDIRNALNALAPYFGEHVYATNSIEAHKI
ncbi:MAG: hypothetical protein ABIG95_00055 [Candidatus Woesearchaeota archaeon]